MPEAEALRILMVGASGRVGRMVLYHWQRDPGPTRIIPQFRSALEGGLTWDPMTGAQLLLDAVRQGEIFHAMVMLAGVTPGLGRDLDLNTRLAQACLDAASRARVRRVLLASSSAVYGAGDGAAFDERAACHPINAYGASKLTMERDCARFRHDGMDLCYLRIGNVAGADALLQNIARADPKEAVEIDIFENGHGPIRSYIGVETMTKVLQTLCLHPHALPPVLNLAAPSPVSMDALADAARHPWTPRAPSENACQHITLNCSALASIHAFTPLDSDTEDMVRQWKATLPS